MDEFLINALEQNDRLRTNNVKLSKEVISLKLRRKKPKE